MLLGAIKKMTSVSSFFRAFHHQRDLRATLVLSYSSDSHFILQSSAIVSYGIKITTPSFVSTMLPKFQISPELKDWELTSFALKFSSLALASSLSCFLFSFISHFSFDFLLPLLPAAQLGFCMPQPLVDLPQLLRVCLGPVIPKECFCNHLPAFFTLYRLHVAPPVVSQLG